MDEYKKILRIAAYLFEYPDESWCGEFLEYRQAASELSNVQVRDVFKDYFDYVEQVGAKEYEQQYVRRFDFSQNTNLYLTTHNRTDFGKQSTEMNEFKQLFLENGYDLRNELPDYLPALLELAATVERESARKIFATVRSKIELLRERFIEAKLPQVFLLDVILTQESALEVS